MQLRIRSLGRRPFQRADWVRQVTRKKGERKKRVQSAPAGTPREVRQEGQKMHHVQTVDKKKCMHRATTAPDSLQPKAEPKSEEDPGSDGVAPDW